MVSIAACDGAFASSSRQDSATLLSYRALRPRPLPGSGFARVRPPRKGEGLARLLHVPEGHDLRHADDAGDGLAPGGAAEELAEIEVVDVVPGVRLQFAGDALPVVERLGGRPFVAQLLLAVVRRPAEPGLVAVRGVP